MPSLSELTTAPGSIQQSIEWLEAGRPEEAARLLEETLDRAPKHIDALHLLGVASFQLGDARRAAECAETAIGLMRRAGKESADFHSNHGRYLITLGRLNEAEAELRRALALAPRHAMARYNLASALAAQGRKSEALAEAERHVREAPTQAIGLHLLATLLSESGRAADALPVFERAIASQAMPETHNNYGNALESLGRSADAVLQYERALRMRDTYAEAASNLGAALQSLGHKADARVWFEQALRMEPGLRQARVNLANLEAANAAPERALEIYRALVEETAAPEAWNNLANLLQDLGRFEEALEAYHQALARNPGYFAVFNNIGNMLRRQGRPAEAIGMFDRAIQHHAQFAEGWNNKGVALADLGRTGEACECYERAMAAKPGYPDPRINLGNIHRDAGRTATAIECYRKATELAPTNAFAWNNLGCALGDANEIAESIRCYQRAVSLMPANHAAFSNILLNLHYLDEAAPQELFAAHREYGERYDAIGEALRAPHQNAPDAERRLRVGYVSSDFRRHSCAFFLEPVVEQHLRGAGFDVFCYADVSRPDEQTARFAKMLGGNWRDIRGYSRERFAAQVRADSIDILVDVGGHTADSRLADFTARPAPVQATWLGYPDTTGLPSIRYRITDALADPQRTAEALHTEELVRLDGGFLCFRPPINAPDPAPTPSLGGAPFTFGSFNNLSKMSPATIAAWASILLAAPGSRIALKNRSLNDPQARARLLKQFAEHGVGEDRILLSGLIEALNGHLEAYSLIDVALDTLPYHGTTTTCEALWMGVPVVTLAGRTHARRVGASLLTAVGLEDLVAGDSSGYAATAVDLWKNPGRLQSARAGLRERMAHSPLRDEAGFARKLEAAYRAMWRTWCAENAR